MAPDNNIIEKNLTNFGKRKTEKIEFIKNAPLCILTLVCSNKFSLATTQPFQSQVSG